MPVHHLLPALGFLSCILAAVPGPRGAHSVPANPQNFLPERYQLIVGGQPGPFVVFDYNTSQKQLKNISTTVDVGTGPSWIEFDQSGEYMFNSDATSTYNNINNTGGVFSSKIDKNGKVTVISSSPTAPEPVRIAIDKKARNIIVGTYTGATVERFTIDPQTRALSKTPAQKIVFTGKSVNPVRQTKAYIHDVQYTPDYAQLVAVDLGADKLRRFKVGLDGHLTRTADVELPAGCGPRHLAWASRRDGDILDAYVICSLTRMLLSFEVDIKADYKFTPKGDPISTEPVHPLNRTTLEGSEILLSPDGRFVVTSTTQTSPDPKFLPDNILVSFPRDLATGSLGKNAIRTPTGGRVPRQFAFDHTGQLIAVGHQGADNVVIFERNVQTGEAKQVAQAPAKRASFSVWRPAT